MAQAPKNCPCHSGLRYIACCAPFHRGTREAETPEALMRSRYAAFSIGLGEYLVKTLASDHTDRSLPREALVTGLSRAHDRQRFLGLSILHACAEGDSGEVLFHARIFERGTDCSFVELSTFRREDGAWRYVSGVLVPASRLPKDLGALDKPAFLACAGRES
jgi:SEC-C motif domain protein